MPSAARLDRDFFQRDPRIVGRELLGCLLVTKFDKRVVSGWIVETESYLAEGDSACHAARGRTAKSEVMFGRAGLAYVYSIHAKHCFNIVTQTIGYPSAVLVRAIEPVEGIRLMQRRRRTNLRELARGPGRLCQALAIDRSHNGLDLTLGRTMWVERTSETACPPRDIRATRRIGVTSARRLQLRFVIRSSPFASGPVHLR